MGLIYFGDLDLQDSDDPMIKEIEDSLVDGRTCVNESPYHPSKYCIFPSYGFPENAELNCSECPRMELNVSGLG